MIARDHLVVGVVGLGRELSTFHSALSRAKYFVCIRLDFRIPSRCRLIPSPMYNVC